MNFKKVVSSLAFKLTERMAVKGIGLIISILLARMLSPEVFGHVAIITIFINLSTTLIQSGFSSALVQKKNATEIDYSTVLVISSLLSLIMVIVLWLCAPLIGKIYNVPTIVMPLRAYSFSLLFGAFNSVQTVRLQKRMKFKALMICSLSATIISGLLGVVCAYKSMGVWALIVYYFLNIVFNCIFIIILERWIPRFGFSIESARSLFEFGWKMLVSSLICSLYADLRSIVIGKKYSTTELAYYSRGQQFPNIISHTIDSAIQSVLFPTFVHEQEFVSKIRAMLSKSISFGAMVIMPTMVGLAIVSETFIEIILSEKWLPCVTYMQILCFADANITFTSSNLTVIKALGRSDLYMKLEVVRRMCMLIILAVSVFCFQSAKAIAIGYLLSAWIDVLIITSLMKKILDFGFIDQIKQCWKIFISVGLMAMAVIAVQMIGLPKGPLLIIQILLGMIVYFVCCYCLNVADIRNMLLSYTEKKHENS